MKLLRAIVRAFDRLALWEARRRWLNARRRLRKRRVVLSSPWDGAIVHNWREPH